MAVHRSQPAASRWSLSELTLREAHGDLLEIEPETAALRAELQNSAAALTRLAS